MQRRTALVGNARDAAIRQEVERRRLARGGVQETGRLVAGEQLAQALDGTIERAVFNGLPDIDARIERAVYEKQQSMGMSRNEALLAVAQETPELFLTRARMQLNQIASRQSIYFDFVNGQLVNPAVMENGMLKPLDAPALDTTGVIAPGSTANQELAMRVAQKMQRLAASGVTTTYTDALRLVASEHPTLTRLARSGNMRRRSI